MAQMRQGLAAWQAKGQRLLQPFVWPCWPRRVGQAGRSRKGCGAGRGAGGIATTLGSACSEAEVYRLKGELLLQQPAEHEREAETCLQQALDIARRQQAKSLELRAAMSLARLWQRQGKRAEAHALLAPIYGWFTEGFDTADFQEARALLEALS